MLTDYRALIGGVLRKGYGLSQPQLAQIFPAAQPADLALDLTLAAADSRPTLVFACRPRALISATVASISLS